jgi:hypothetical protein
VYVVKNTGSFAITMFNSTVLGNTTAAGTGLSVAAGATASMFTDGTNFSAAGLPSGGATTGTGSLVFSASPTLTGVPLAPTANAGTNTTQIATTAFVTTAVTASIPSGLISLWSGSVASIPSGWLLCNGSSGTPDLRNRFIVGAGSTYAVAATGGSANATLVSHTHTATSVVTDPGHNHSYIASTLGGTGGLTATNDAAPILNTGTSSTGITVATTNSTEGSSATNANLPPYYALAYIMKA